MLPIEEYAISRLMLRWPIAANEPSAIDAIETNTTICCHCGVISGNAAIGARTKIAIAAVVCGEGKDAVTGVGAAPKTSGGPMWNGTAETLKQKPANRN